MDDLERHLHDSIVNQKDAQIQKLRDEQDRIRAAFTFMGPKTQAGLTLEALAKGAGIMFKAVTEDLDLLRAEFQAMTKHADEGWKLAADLGAENVQLKNAPPADGKPKTETFIPVEDVQIQCCHCRGWGELKHYQVRDGVVDLRAMPTDPFGMVPCPTCDGWGVVIATELRAVTQWEKVKKIER